MVHRRHHPLRHRRVLCGVCWGGLSTAPSPFPRWRQGTGGRITSRRRGKRAGRYPERRGVTPMEAIGSFSGWRNTRPRTPPLGRCPPGSGDTAGRGGWSPRRRSRWRCCSTSGRSASTRWSSEASSWSLGAGRPSHRARGGGPGIAAGRRCDRASPGGASPSPPHRGHRGECSPPGGLLGHTRPSGHRGSHSEEGGLPDPGGGAHQPPVDGSLRGPSLTRGR